jgi:anti-sigma B factor antagonist
MIPQASPLEIYAVGPLTVLGFYGREVLEGFTALECRDLIREIVAEHQCRTIAFDLTNVKLIPSGMLGLFASIKRSGIDVLLFNPTLAIREILEIMRLNTILQIEEVEIPHISSLQR